jgi:hypothetical protein
MVLTPKRRTGKDLCNRVGWKRNKERNFPGAGCARFLWTLIRDDNIKGHFRGMEESVKQSRARRRAEWIEEITRPVIEARAEAKDGLKF